MFIGGVAIGLVVFVIFEFLLLLVLAANERPYAGLLSFLSAIAACDFFFGTEIFSMMYHAPLTTLGVVAAYITAGVFWSFPKWFFYVKKIRDAYVKSLEVYKKRNSLVELSDEQWKDFYYHPSYGYDDSEGIYNSWNRILPVRASSNKNRILVWMMYWPFSMTWTLIDEPFKKAFQFVFEKIKSVYQKISESVFSGVELYDPNSAKVVSKKETKSSSWWKAS